MSRFSVGVQLQPQLTTIEALRAAWIRADAMGADSIWTWDHFFPVPPQPGSCFEGWSLLSAMAVDTANSFIGMLVSGNGYRNPDVLAHMAFTVDQLSGGRLILGLGAGWSERDYEEYQFEFGTAGSRLSQLAEALPRIKSRLATLDSRPLPLLIGGGGEKVTLKLVAEHADMWNGFGPPERFAKKSAVLDQWCDKIGRDPSAIERTAVWGGPDLAKDVERYLEAGATHLIFSCRHPFDFDPVLTELLDQASK